MAPIRVDIFPFEDSFRLVVYKNNTFYTQHVDASLPKLFEYATQYLNQNKGESYGRKVYKING